MSPILLLPRRLPEAVASRTEGQAADVPAVAIGMRLEAADPASPFVAEHSSGAGVADAPLVANPIVSSATAKREKRS
jgi:hypothetical protein